jgi:hypothetical protein
MSIQAKINQIVANVGRQGLHALYPNEFEYYMMAFELVDGDDNMVDYLMFPILPDNIQRNSVELINIKKTLKGVTTLKTTSFVPVDLTISGTFGRQLKMLIGNQQLNFQALQYSTKNNIWTKDDVMDKARVKSGLLNTEIKTGYGVTKLLESICAKSNCLDSKNKPMRLHFYNSLWGESSIVTIKSFNVTQNKDQYNAMWQYQITMTAIAPLDQIINTKKLSNTAFNTVQKSINQLARIARSYIS